MDTEIKVLSLHKQGIRLLLFPYGDQLSIFKHICLGNLDKIRLRGGKVMWVLERALSRSVKLTQIQETNAVC